MDEYGTALEYFIQPRGHFWHWAENGQVVEWEDRDQTTVCYREELSELLLGLREHGLPPLAPLLLLLAACNNHWPKHPVGTVVLRQLVPALPPADDDPAQAKLQDAENAAIHLLHAILNLPTHLRTGPAKLHLLREIFKAQVPQVSPAQARAMLDEWNSGRLDVPLASVGHHLTRRRHLHELSCLADAHARFPTTDDLARHLRTGLAQPPAPLPALLQMLNSVAQQTQPITPVTAPPAPVGSLLDQLGTDERTAGLAQLARHLLAGLRIPAPAQAAGEQPLGGVADLTNRGTLDRLLLSELAHDELTLTARLANNEALYWRREEPPRPHPPTPVLLLDTTLRLWGTPRVFGLAAALAWAQLTGAPPKHTSTRAYALGGTQATLLDLSTLGGVVEALTYLDAAPHCGAALHALAQQPPVAGLADYVLITAAELVQQSLAFGQLLAAPPLPLRFLLTVDRDGTLALYEWVNGHRLLRSTAYYDLDELLFTAVPPLPPAAPQLPADAPAFWRQQPAPLLLPVVGLRVNAANSFLSPELGALAITSARCLLHWPRRHAGAREVLARLENGHYHFGTDAVSYLAVLVHGAGLLRVHRLDTATSTVSTFDLSDELTEATVPLQVAFLADCFRVRQASGTLVFDSRRGQVVGRREKTFPVLDPGDTKLKVQAIKQFMGSRYNALLRVKTLEVSERGVLLIDGHELQTVSNLDDSGHHLLLAQERTNAQARTCATLVGTEPLPANPQLLVRRFAWPDGSQSLLDPRGLLHLRSADSAVPEVTLVLVLGVPTAAWAADGTVCGPAYFTGLNAAQPLGASDFKHRYLQPFIKRLG